MDIQKEADDLAALEREVAERRIALADKLHALHEAQHRASPIAQAIESLRDAIVKETGSGAGGGAVTVCLDHRQIVAFALAPCRDPRFDNDPALCHTRQLFKR